MSNWLVKHRHGLLAATLVVAALCGVLMLHVNINTDLTRYLPADSPMKAGLDLLQDELGMNSEMAGASIRIMTQGQTEEDMVATRYRLLQLPEVSSVTLQERHGRTLYELATASDIDQQAVGKRIRADFPEAQAVETAQDGTTADAGMLVGALSLLLLVLAAMCASWLEPVLFLASTGVAVLLNMGTNALLPSVSVTTHSIAAILQLVLSMDYSIILLNRYRQQRALADSSASAMGQAIRMALPAVLSSALTTIVGLLMLMFMKLRIGADLGIVLSKGVLFSLLCNFTVLPSLILLFERGIERTRKKVLALPTDRLARFSMKYRIPLALIFVALLAGSYWLHNQTPISFHNAQASQIDPFFPKKNPVVLVYDNADESRIVPLIDSLCAQPEVEMALSYPSLMLREYRAPQMAAAIQDLAAMASQAGGTAPDLPLDMLSEDVLRLVYYAARGEQIQALDFNTVAGFLLTQAKDPRSFLASQMSDDMKQKMALFEDFRKMDSLIEPATPGDSTAAAEPEPASAAPEPAPAMAETAPVVHQAAEPAAAQPLSPFADTVQIRRDMDCAELAAFLGMDAGQAKMVFRLAKKSGQTMSPLAFVRFLTDDILRRKALSAMISAEQKQQLLDLRATMDSALAVRTATVQPEVEPARHPAALPVQPAAPEPVATAPAEEAAPADSLAPADDPLSLIDEMMSSQRRYTAREMALNFNAMGEPVDESLIRLLYLYYGGMTRYNPEWTLSLHHLLAFLADTLAGDPQFSHFITPDMRHSLTQARALTAEKLSMMRGPRHSAAVVVTSLPTESDSTYAFLDRFERLADSLLTSGHHSIGESVMMREMKQGFSREMLLVTLLTIVAIFLIVALSFRSALIALILVATVMTGVFVDVSFSALGGGSLLYMAYLVVQSILMGAAIDYGILFANYYREHRAALPIADALREAYRGSIHTILTSGLILILVPGAMSVLVADPTVASIVRAIAVGAFATVVLILLVLPGMLATCDRWICPKK